MTHSIHWFKNIWLIAFGGAIGAVLRFTLSEAIHMVADRRFPVGILTVNVLGSFLMGFLAILLFDRMAFAAEYRSILLIGLLGAFTTFSTFSMDTVLMIQSGRWGAALLNVLLSVVLCLLATGAGIYVAKWIA